MDSRIGYFHWGPIIGWNVDAEDWRAKNPDVLTQSIVHQTKPGSIILLHDTKIETTKALPAIIDQLKAQGYTFVPLATLIGYRSSTDYRDEVFFSGKEHHQINKVHQKTIISD